MVIFLQLCIFAVYALARGQFLFGRHLRQGAWGSETLEYTVLARFGGPTAKHLGLIQQGGTSFVIRRETWYHRWLKALGIASEINVGNAAFDESFFISTDMPHHLERLLASHELQAQLQQLFRMGVTSLHATRRRLWCVISGPNAKKPDPDYASYMDLLRSISADTRAAPAGAAPASRRRGVVAVTFVAAQAGVLMLGVFGFIPTLADSFQTADMRSLMVTGLTAGAAAAGLWFLCILLLFRGTSWVSWVVADFALCGLLGFMLSGIAVAREVNIRGPQPGAAVYAQPIVEKQCILECSKGGRRSSRRHYYVFTSAADCQPSSREAVMISMRQSDPYCASYAAFEYAIRLAHWREAKPYRFMPGPEIFDAVKTGDRLLIPVHPGALGLEWVDPARIRVL